MSLLDFFKRPAAAEPAGPDGDAAVVLRARAHARRRLIGAAVLLTLGVIGFPLLFETRPRPIPVDIPIEIPPKEGAAGISPPPRPRAAGPVVMEPASAEAAAASAVATSGTVAAANVPPAAPKVAEAASAASTTRPAVAAAAVVAAATTAAVVTLGSPTPKPSASAASAAPPKAAVAAAPVVVPAAPPASSSLPGNARYVVQVGAFADATAARAARLRVEKLGLKTFTQEIQKDGARRIRVRVGPYTTKAEAEKAAKTIQKGDLPAAVLLL